MHTDAFPPCPVHGPILPAVPHGYIGGAIPQKCSTCELEFEGSCQRAMSQLGRFLSLDYGPCRVNGSTQPVRYENQFITSRVDVPEKCTTCRFLTYLSVYGFRCGEDAEIWGRPLKTLDWGSWHPEFIYVELPQPKITTRPLIERLWQRDLLGFLKEYRRVNPDTALSEAREDDARLLQLITEQN